MTENTKHYSFMDVFTDRYYIAGVLHLFFGAFLFDTATGFSTIDFVSGLLYTFVGFAAITVYFKRLGNGVVNNIRGEK